MEAQPSEIQEAANAAYVWRKYVQEDLIAALKQATSLKDVEKVEWSLERWLRAIEREKVADALVETEKEI